MQYRGVFFKEDVVVIDGHDVVFVVPQQSDWRARTEQLSFACQMCGQLSKFR